MPGHEPGIRFGPEVRPKSCGSVCQGVRANLELDHLGQGSLASFHVEWRPVPVGGPQTAAFPAGIRIVDAAVHPLGIEAERIRDTHVDPLAVHEGHERLVGVAGGHRYVGAETRGVELVDKGEVARFGAAAFSHVLELRSPERRECPSLWTKLTFGRLRAVEWALALATVECAHVTA